MVFCENSPARHCPPWPTQSRYLRELRNPTQLCVTVLTPGKHLGPGQSLRHNRMHLVIVSLSLKLASISGCWAGGSSFFFSETLRDGCKHCFISIIWNALAISGDSGFLCSLWSRLLEVRFSSARGGGGSQFNFSPFWNLGRPQQQVQTRDGISNPG